MKPSVAFILGFSIFILALIIYAYILMSILHSNNSSNINRIRAVVEIGNIDYNVFYADNNSSREIGLMNYTNFSLDGIVGEYFSFNNYSELCFWMKNTPEPLYQIWIADNRSIFIYNATPYSLRVVCHYGNAVLEIYKNLNIEIEKNETIKIVKID
ncbi:MAG: hypothetical protein ARM1_0826 [Candidatus Micrarchaeota archaeon]|nr:MAG: hypothetical protein ARM1_0826 [Candidatus Micrarchaeota archaeon]